MMQATTCYGEQKDVRANELLTQDFRKKNEWKRNIEFLNNHTMSLSRFLD